MENKYVDTQLSKRIDEIETMLTGDFSAGVPCTDRKFWDGVQGIDRVTLISEAEKLMEEPFPVITEEIYYERKYKAKNFTADKILFTSARRLEKLVLAECVENKGRFVDCIAAAIETILARKSWVRPGHDSAFSYSDYTGVHGLIDLYSASLGWRLSVCDRCLGGKLPEEFRCRMKTKIREKIIDVFLKRLDEEPESIMINGIVPLYWLDAYDNWLSVCLGGVLGAILYYGESREKALIIALYEKLIQNYLHSLPDGYCVEGLAYWGYGFGKFIAASDLIYRATDGKIDLYAQKEFSAAGEFGFKISIAKDVYPSAADCGFGTEPLAFCMKYCAMRAGLEYSYEFEAVNNDIYIVMMMLNFDRRLTNTLKSELAKPLRTYFAGQGILISRTADYSFGAYIQAGTNHEPHNHNDIGSFIIAADGESFVVDPGFSEYKQITFSPERYSLEVLSSLGHSVPRVSGMLQGPAVFGSVNTNYASNRNESQYEDIRFVAKVIKTEFSDSADSITVDITSAYDCANLKKLVRKMTFDREQRAVTICDSFEFCEQDEIETAFVTFFEVELESNSRLRILGEQNVMNVEIDGGGIITARCIKDGVCGDHDIPVYPLRIAKRVRGRKGDITMKFTIGRGE